MGEKCKVAIVDFEVGNLFSVKQACEHVGLQTMITHEKKEILGADAVILPGVGAFGDAMKFLKEKDLISPIKDLIQNGRPFLGICLGMQLLLSESEEFGLHQGLNIIGGRVARFPEYQKNGERNKIPQVGWNKIQIPNFQGKKLSANYWEKSLLKTLNDGEYMYFVHSYYAIPANPEVILSTTDYEGITYCSGLQYKNISAFQFHPEKSAQRGIQIYKNWAESIQPISAIVQKEVSHVV